MTTLRAWSVLSLMLPALAAAQGQPSRGQILAGGRDIIQKARYCSFITAGEDGHPQARIVDPLGPDDNFTFWIATNPLTRKVGQIRRDPRVTLLCFDAATASYATVLAKAAIVTDAEEKARHWKAAWTPFYSGGAQGSDVVLVRLSPSRLEVVGVSRGLNPDPKTWLPLAVTFP
ncbi:MAG: pyridoxamine 5'-phosphate oxidase family protein [Acidobacteriota bacterium]|nr:pyridoxamine 5'-phosphate oxidase family protein [Acidobacteriota bacterium]